MHTFNRSILAILTATLCQQAQAQAEKILTEVTVTDQREAQAERKNAPLQKIVIAEEEVERYGDATVGDVLRRLPGMSFTGPAGVAKDVRMRGLDKGYTLFLINGEPVPGAAQERQMQVDRLPADMIERIEIIRNPSAEYDAGGIGGTINIVLKNRADNLTRLRAAYGRNGDLGVGDVVAQWSHRYDELDLILAGSHTVGAEDVVEVKDKLNAGGSVSEREHKRKPVKKSETLLTPRLSWRLGENRLILDPYFSTGTEDKRENAEVRNAAGALNKLTTNNEDKTDQLARLGGRYEGKAAWGNWYAKAALQQGSSDKDKFATETNGSNVISKRTQEIENIQEDQVFAGAGLAVPLGAHLLKAGAEQRHTEYEKNKTVAEAGNASNPLTPKAPGANDIYSIKEAKSILYLQDQWQLAARHWLTSGLRYESVARDATDRNGIMRSGTQASPNPSLHYRWALRKDLNIRASVAQTLKLPKFDDVNPLLTLATGADAGTSFNPDKGGNAELKPERALGIELGMEKFFRGNRGAAGVNFYNRDVKDFIEKSANVEGVRYVQRPHNVGDAHFWGAEFDWRIPLVHKGPHELSLTGNHAELRGEVSKLSTGATQNVKDMPPRITNLGVNWTHRPSKWSAGFSLNHQPTFTTDTDNDNGEREVKTLKAMNTLDLYVTKVFGPLAELRLIAKNVLSIDKQEDKIKYNANGTVKDGENKIERSKPTIFLTFESRF